MSSYEKERAIAEAATPGPWCESYCFEAIRHVVRNCDIECPTHPWAATDFDSCKSFGKYDGLYIAMVYPQFVLGLLDKVEQYEAALESMAGATTNSPAHFVAVANRALNSTEAKDD